MVPASIEDVQICSCASVIREIVPGNVDVSICVDAKTCLMSAICTHCGHYLGCGPAVGGGIPAFVEDVVVGS
ncbi:MAG: hypothetical protein ACFFC7_20960 [Candidatus Hermodarchaeota archaeon]